MKFLRFFSPYEWFLLIAIVTLNFVVFFITGEWDMLSTVATVSGVLCVVLVAKGHISNYLFGLIQVSLYTYLSWGVGYWGEVVLNGLYYVPMQFIGFFMWRKRTREGSRTCVRAKNLTERQRLVLFIVCAALIALGGFVLKYYGDPAPFLDSTTTFLSIVAMFLMVKTYSEQWYLWITVNVATIIMWGMAYFREGQASHLIIASMWCVYLLNSVHGLFVWKKAAKTTSLTN
ncbi:MAG: nicotinamide riboside transporter PnuC [Bacteroidales bacterium]|jgi:nicotinamide mononucleotide transporter|nr:nicotinamide riboside transporter PnuC [Bacteroidales bacterium]MDD2263358.1 nicotinamide riboside transporter PnuC [Bacteroidales bacterium]MDD2830852.1 nicotinamide riboside transporter PnuC [Bacteroidales bacterium]MDD3208051.1 nicotinamide riboside transporter PnuC [Bacteroidales bacterium]MDD3696442.1 nicotinamide riboside transporter PnuC [Bacteroidales bacterium]